jgi:hypothetical protein
MLPGRPRIVFFIDPKLWPQGVIPDAPDIAWTGYRLGPYCWEILTVLHLQRAGYDCEISSVLPDDGIVLTHRECCTFDGAKLLPDRRRLLINLAADQALYPSANLQVVQNPVQAYWYKNCYYIPLWPEPGLRARVPSSRFKNISFMGMISQFASELGSEEWSSTLRQLGLNWAPRIETFQFNDPADYRIGDGAWTDLSEIDAVVAIRQFTSYPTFDQKPPSKLINCWLAGIPAILGAESAYRTLYRSELDYIEAHSKEEVIAALIQLRDNPDLRAAMAENGFRRSREVSAEATVQRWIRFLEDVAIPSYNSWTRLSKTMQQVSIADSRISNFAARLRRKISTPTRPPKKAHS